jgi:hypothetical protein
VEFVQVRTLERVLAQALGQLAANADQRRNLEECVHSRDVGELRAEFLDYLVGAVVPVGTVP